MSLFHNLYVLKQEAIEAAKVNHVNIYYEEQIEQPCLEFAAAC